MLTRDWKYGKHLFMIFAILWMLTGMMGGTPQPVQAGTVVVVESISSGGSHTCALKSDGTVACWGENIYGQSNPPFGTFTQVSAGGEHTCGIRSDGTLACWGHNDYGQSSPPSGTFTQVSAGYYHSCGVKSDGTLHCWGAGTTNTGLFPIYGQSMPPAGTFTQVSAGGEHTCGIKSNGTIACWGYNNHGQSLPPVGTFSQVSAGYEHTCGLTSSGTPVCWGYNNYGQSSPPTGSFTQVSAGDSFTCWLLTNGTLSCWGDNMYGKSTPPADTFTQVSAGADHACGVKSDNTVACWGSNAYGQSNPYPFSISGNAGVAGATLSYTDGIPKTATADGSGNYSFTVFVDWSGTVTPSEAGYTFTPDHKDYTDVLANLTGENYTAAVTTYSISGNAGVGGATLSYTDGTPKTATAASDGSYSFTVSYNWSGLVTPSLTGYVFSPVDLSYANVLADQSGQNYTAIAITYTITGNAGVGGATLSYTDGTPKTATADSSGNYWFTVSYNWSGTVTPSKIGYTFIPPSYTYFNVLSNQTVQNYAATPVATFADVPTTYWAWNYIERLYHAGITGGCGSSPLIYCPDNSVTRAQMAIFLERGMNGSSYTPPAATGTVFSDVPIAYWSAAWIEKLFADGITGGCGGGNYCPANPVTRAQMAIFLLRAEHGASYAPPAATGTVFGDVPISYWDAAWIEKLSADGITGGCGGGNYCPANPVTRAQMAVFLVRTFNLP